MFTPLQKTELYISGLFLLLTIFALIQASIYTQRFNEQSQQNQANVLYANELLTTIRNKRTPEKNIQKMYSNMLGTTPKKIQYETTSTITPLTNPPTSVNAKAYIVADIYTGTIYAKKNIDIQYPIASITKLITALTSSTVIPPDAQIQIKPPPPIKRNDYRQIIKGDSISAINSLYPLLMESNNAVAHALAQYYGTDNFINNMSEQTRMIKMNATKISDASGISTQNTSTVRDLFKLARHIYANAPFIFEITRNNTITIPSKHKKYTIRNKNHFYTDPAFIGGKTGYTPTARQTMLSIFNIPFKDNERPVAIIILKSNERKKDIQRLYKWLMTQINPTKNIYNSIQTKDGVTYVTGPSF